MRGDPLASLIRDPMGHSDDGSLASKEIEERFTCKRNCRCSLPLTLVSRAGSMGLYGCIF